MIASISSDTGTRATVYMLISSELTIIISEARWMLAILVVCVIADFRYGWGESNRRYHRAKEKGNDVLASQYKWRTSRAVRRTVNKLIDYLIWITLGMIAGLAILEPFGAEHKLGGAVATAIAFGCEFKSIIGHFLYLHGIDIDKKNLGEFMRTLVVSVVKRKNEDIGDALKESLNEIEKDKGE